MNEGPLHAAIKAWYLQPGDHVEVPFRGRQIDIVRGELLIEIQTGSFTALRKKIAGLVDTHAVRVVHPVPVEKWIVRVGDDGEQVLGRRRSPLRGRVEDAFEELVGLHTLLAHPRFSFEVLLTREEEVRRHEAGRVWRRKGWTIVERRLVDVVDRRVFAGARDLQALLPEGLPTSFTTADLATGAGIARALAQKMAYCLRAAGALQDDGKQGHARAHTRTPL
jgi:hypothetical protein